MSLSRRRLLDDTVKRTAQGNPITVRSVARMKPGIKVFGKSEQFTTTGAQLLNKQTSGSSRGVPWSSNEGIVTFNGQTSDSDSNRVFAAIPVLDILEQGTTYYAKVFTTGINVYLKVEKPSGTLYPNTVTVDGTETAIDLRIIVDGTAGVFDLDVNVVAYVALTKDANMSSYEPYTGGKPSPSIDYPQEITNAGDSGSITVNIQDENLSNTQTLTISTPNGLPGIPVDSGGNYTDSDGQQWVCDEIDLKRGKYVKRVNMLDIEDANTLIEQSIDPDWYPETSYSYEVKNVPNANTSLTIVGKSSHFPTYGFNDFYNKDIEFGCKSSGGYFIFNIPKSLGICTTVDGFKQWYKENGVVTQLALETPIETDLSASDLAVYQSCHTNRPTTVLTSPDNVGLELSYKTRKSLEVE